MGKTPHIAGVIIVQIIYPTVKSERLGKRTLNPRPTNGAGEFSLANKTSLPKSPPAQVRKVRGAGRTLFSRQGDPAIPNGRVRASATGLGKRAQAALRVSEIRQLRISERRYRRLFQAARDGILILDPETRKITDVNPFMIEFLGYT